MYIELDTNIYMYIIKHSIHSTLCLKFKCFKKERYIRNVELYYAILISILFFTC